MMVLLSSPLADLMASTEVLYFRERPQRESPFLMVWTLPFKLEGAGGGVKEGALGTLGKLGAAGGLIGSIGW